MLTLVVTVVLGLAFALFATQNTQGVDLNFGSYYLPNVPVYLVALFPLLMGLLASLIIHTAKDLMAGITIDEDKKEIKKMTQENAELVKEVHKLELENTKLKAKNGEEFDEDSI
ncbi:hypothetical protein A2962_02915 [Candidatus Woesebacteria bacterium RIFCSPLOWO2_01_FULL_39_61]|uniref:Lipopolysaccharide assembly protein A domain-containing protein n=1 Tax=Candidatus Woesebacteria bacterium RIFCSPHIGHO2_02_FULL_39_13 TaxID=1802505 RepID=A0A1F7YYS8_9BACT|nr:MAG: hypothetical protein A3D01_04630 [Candidatus Woesebacteria bacterium RIFCSPHIGHO2_02_FULL_39_13]OGM67390.1 MAG: hypothetical protein A2962_02915 [Candidatus Woesebacteria bacterium RIFCSPLOWO2_01_FULL_39_61]